jgi:hypothetical protein
MCHELFYTSSPRGLQPGSRGFCTVAVTKGMSAAMRETLEALSGYRPLFPPHDPKAGLNPVAWSHLRVTIAGKPFSLLSRICSAGPDYTERSNKFAHHVLLEPGEQAPGGPAWMLAQPGFMERQWDGKVRVIEQGRTPPWGDEPAASCAAWEELTGDAAWAGVLAEAYQRDPEGPVYFLFEPGMDLLPLVREAIAALPAERRWDVTFSTYYAALPQGVRCSWRAVPRDSAEAKVARRASAALVLDLASDLGPASGSTAARLLGGLPSRAAAQRALAEEPVHATAPPSPFLAPGVNRPDAWPPRPTLLPTSGDPAAGPPALPAAREGAGKGWLLGLVAGLMTGILLAGLGVVLAITTGVIDVATKPVEDHRAFGPEKEPSVATDRTESQKENDSLRAELAREKKEHQNLRTEIQTLNLGNMPAVCTTLETGHRSRGVRARGAGTTLPRSASKAQECGGVDAPVGVGGGHRDGGGPCLRGFPRRQIHPVRE